ncbi:hypothetical protein [Thermoflexibacter ruber]|uniref:Uncharacterized protein n=1 Tax=Thermoflexibacter ruber TaxID=1003 RepID=A0A1I2FUC8_9BACT|nr:hypothetical protein [Thermoflexibacter ruber]SFF08041.1 hypothetical protein SAMN04488541_101525 [Thermoflexibacter ruber]
MNEVFVKLKRNFGLTLILAIGLGVEFTNFQSMFFRFMLSYRPDWGAINHVPAMFLSAFLLLCIVIFGIRKQVVLSWFLALLTCVVSFTVYSRMELSWEWEKMDELNFVVLILSAMLPMLVAYSTHQIAHDEEEDMSELMADLERRKRRQMQNEMIRQKELQYAQERKRLKASLAQALREEERMKMRDLQSYQNGFANPYQDDEDFEPVYQKAKYSSTQEDLAEKFVTSKQYNSVNFTPIRDKSSKNTSYKPVENKEKSNHTKERYAEEKNTESKLKTTPKIMQAKPQYEEAESRVVKNEVITRNENLSKRFREEIEKEQRQEQEKQEVAREVVFNFAKNENVAKHIPLSKMSEDSNPRKVAGGYKITCVHCGKEVVKKSKTAKYCSTSCRVAHNKESGIEDDGKGHAFYLVKDDFENSGVIEWANAESV